MATVLTTVYVADKWVEWLLVFGDALALRLADDEAGVFEATWTHHGVAYSYQAPDIIAAIRMAYDDGHARIEAKFSRYEP
jgi:hypothetical protein